MKTYIILLCFLTAGCAHTMRAPHSYEDKLAHLEEKAEHHAARSGD